LKHSLFSLSQDSAERGSHPVGKRNRFLKEVQSASSFPPFPVDTGTNSCREAMRSSGQIRRPLADVATAAP
jgi:hypothetical protein